MRVPRGAPFQAKRSVSVAFTGAAQYAAAGLAMFAAGGSDSSSSGAVLTFLLQGHPMKTHRARSVQYELRRP
jgi:hypothetical protein